MKSKEEYCREEDGEGMIMMMMMMMTMMMMMMMMTMMMMMMMMMMMSMRVGCNREHNQYRQEDSEERGDGPIVLLQRMGQGLDHRLHVHLVVGVLRIRHLQRLEQARNFLLLLLPAAELRGQKFHLVGRKPGGRDHPAHSDGGEGDEEGEDEVDGAEGKVTAPCDELVEEPSLQDAVRQRWGREGEREGGEGREEKEEGGGGGGRYLIEHPADKPWEEDRPEVTHDGPADAADEEAVAGDDADEGNAEADHPEGEQERADPCDGRGAGVGQRVEEVPFGPVVGHGAHPARSDVEDGGEEGRDPDGGGDADLGPLLVHPRRNDDDEREVEDDAAEDVAVVPAEGRDLVVAHPLQVKLHEELAGEEEEHVERNLLDEDVLFQVHDAHRDEDERQAHVSQRDDRARLLRVVEGDHPPLMAGRRFLHGCRRLQERLEGRGP
eukprot:763026-Hanusia_phi.AAC.1